jgi:hypothetical protein
MAFRSNSRDNDLGTYASRATATSRSADVTALPQRNGKLIRRMDGILATLCALGILFLQQFKVPLETYTGVSVTFKTPNVLRLSAEEVLQQQVAQEYSQLHDTLFVDADDEFLSSDEDGSHDTPVKWLLPPVVKAWEEYQFHHSHDQLQDELVKCQERANVRDDEHIHYAVKEGWCPELEHRKFLVITRPSCHSPQALLERYLRIIPWAMVSNRTLLWKELETKQGVAKTEDSDDNNDDDACKGVLTMEESALAPYSIWKQQLDLPEPVAWDLANLDRGERDTPLLIDLEKPQLGRRPSTTTTVLPELQAMYMKRPYGKRMASILLEKEGSSYLYGMLMSTTLTWKEPERMDLGIEMFQEDDTVVGDKDDVDDDFGDNSGEGETSGEKRFFYANLKLAPSSLSTSQSGYVDEDCIDQLKPNHPLSPCVVYSVGGGGGGGGSSRRSLAGGDSDIISSHNNTNNNKQGSNSSSMSSNRRRRAQHQQPQHQLSSCVVYEQNLDPKNFVPALVFAAQARHGVILPRVKDMSSEETAFATLLQQLSTYRGKSKVHAKFNLPVCRVTN